MLRFIPILERTNIEVGDLPPAVELNGCLLYFGPFPEGDGRLLVHPRIEIEDNPDCIALVAHELAHMLLHRLYDHPPSVVDLLFDPSQRALYDYYEREADRLAAYLLVRPDIWDGFPVDLFPTPERLAEVLGVPARCVRLAFEEPWQDPEPVHTFLLELIGQPDFLAREAIAA
ncbi:MAG: ImmA/IrrE family metallo-endopeptidase [Anaerolineae bacterium]